MIHEVWSLCFVDKIDLWVDRVASKFNLSDSPSRGEHEVMAALEAEWKEPVWGKLQLPSDHTEIESLYVA